MNRLSRTLACSGLVAFVASLTTGDVELAAATGVLALGVGIWVLRLGRAAPDESWSSRAPHLTAAPPEPATTGAVVRALGSAESRELVFSPWLAAGLGLCAVMVISFASSYDGHESWWDVIDDLPFLAHPLVGMTLLAAHRNATRAARDRTAELFDVCPASGARRSGALLAAWCPMLVLLLFCVAYLGVVALTTPVGGTIGAAAVPTVLGAVVLGAGGVSLGLALAGSIRSPLAPVVALVAVGFVSLELGEGSPGEFRARMLLSTFGTSLVEDVPPLDAGRAWFHLGWLVGLTGVAGAAALATRRGDRVDPKPAAASSLEPVPETGAAR